MSAGLSENFSENQKPKRGRPRLVNSKLEDVYRSDCGSFTSARTVQNTHYRIRALTALGLFSEPFPEAFRWLCDPSKQMKGQSARQGFRRTILSELGRFADDEVLRAYAELICTLKPKTQDAIQMLRRWRVGD